MAAALSTLIQQTRRYLRDWADFDSTTSLANSSTTTINVADTSIYANRWPIEIDQETMVIRAVPNSTTLTVLRGAYGSTATSHASSSSVLVRPAFYSVEIIDAINEGMSAAFPYLYRPIVDTTLTVNTNQYQYVVPNMPGLTGYPIPRIYRIDVLQPGDYTFRHVRRWEIQRGSVTSGSPASSGSVSSTYPIIQFKSLPPVGATIRVHGYGPFSALASTTDTLDTLFPPDASYILPIYAAASLLMSGEAGRVRVSSGATDTREQANRVGASMQAGAALMKRFRQELMSCQMPPLSKHIKTVI